MVKGSELGIKPDDWSDFIQLANEASGSNKLFCFLFTANVAYLLSLAVC